MFALGLTPRAEIVEAPLKDFANANLHLEDLFGASDVAMCDELLAAAQTSAERIAGVQSFLLRRLRPQIDNLANRAALHLKQDPAMQMHSPRRKTGL